MPRVEFDGALYHLLCRGDRREAIFRDEKDREISLATLGEICRRDASMGLTLVNRALGNAPVEFSGTLGLTK